MFKQKSSRARARGIFGSRAADEKTTRVKPKKRGKQKISDVHPFFSFEYTHTGRSTSPLRLARAQSWAFH